MFTILCEKEYKTGAAQITSALEVAGVTNIFGYPGASILALYNELADSKVIKHCLCRHEQACVHAAEGYARVSGKIGVVIVTSGPGATNTVTGIANAFADNTPLLILAGAPNNTVGKVFQHIDFKNMVSSIVKDYISPKPNENLFDIITNAIQTATTGKKGPVVVELTRNLLEQHLIHKIEPLKATTISPNYADTTRLTQLLNTAQKPLFIIGGGCKDCFNEITDFINSTQINTVSTLMGVGKLSSTCQYYKGMIGVNGVEEANKILFDSDLIVALGVAYSDRTICKSEIFANNTPVVNVNIEPYKLNNVNIVLELNIDCKTVVRSLQQSLISAKNTAKNIVATTPIKTTSKMSTCEVLKCINEYTKSFSPIVITDVGQHQMFAAQHFQFTKPKRFITSGGLGTMGFGLPASCGAHFAEPNTCIINITGDGSFQMNIQELATVREYQIPVKIFVMNNSYLGMIRQTQEKLYNGKYYQSKMHNPNFITLAKGYGIKGIQVKTIRELEKHLPKIFNSKAPIIVNCITNEFETV